MTSWLTLGLLLLAACTAGDETASGARGACAEGGALTDCPDSAHTPQAACSRMVACGAIPISSTNNGTFDWGACVDRIEQSIDAQQTLIIDCIAASSCDALKVQGSPDDPQRDQMACFHLGGR